MAKEFRVTFGLRASNTMIGLLLRSGVRMGSMTVHAAGVLTRGRRSEQVSVVELTPAEVAPLLEQAISIPYSARFTHGHFDVTPDSSLKEFEMEAPRHQVFLVQSAAQCMTDSARG